MSDVAPVFDPADPVDLDFTRRHIGPDQAAIDTMLNALGYSSLDELTAAAIPESIQSHQPLATPAALAEHEVLAEVALVADANEIVASMIGLGYCRTRTPGVILRNVLENPAWYTAYTPYQPEIAQGRLEALLNFQTVIEDLVGLPIAGASLLDEPTAAAEAMALAWRAHKGEGSVFLVDADTHPQTLAVLRTRAEPLQIEIQVRELPNPELPLTGVFGALMSYPGSSGRIWNMKSTIELLHAQDITVICATDLLAMTLLTPPGELGADVVIGSAQRFGVPMGFGGPHAAFMAVRAGLERTLPGRLVGVSVDADGNPAYRLALQTREQHIRREKATSNICTAQVLLAVIASMYAAYHGPSGLRAMAARVHAMAVTLAEGLDKAGAQRLTDGFFDTVRWSMPGKAAGFQQSARLRGINVRQVDEDTVSVTTDECTSLGEIQALLDAYADVTHTPTPQAALTQPVDAFADMPRWDSALRRATGYLAHPVFNRYQSETAMLRYLRRLADRDVALDRSMIPLGSCTMKLNATTEMAAITWPAFANIHPFAPVDQANGYVRMIRDLEAWLADITGYDAVSLQPNAGSQGEFAGLLAIRGYHHARGDHHRDICLIPSSAHGTNAASAVMAGMRVVVVRCDELGNVDLADLQSHIAEHRDKLAALMITYPSTHGVFESAVKDICAAVHDAGGQVYVDGANLNALVGLAQPGRFGADVSHLNLHKTFCIPHGGGGPGVGPVAVRAHLAPYLPNHPLRPECGPAAMGFADGGVGPVSGAPWGSAGILPIPWAYIRLMGPDGLRKATQVAILTANYVAKRLAPHYPVLYTGQSGLVAHECILDLRSIAAETGVTVDDVAKRLMDYGFHAPTMSFPVAGTLMVEPTESEDLPEVERFIEAMISIRAEISRVASGEWNVESSPIRQAPHTAECLVGDWTLPYPRELGAYPVPHLRRAKVWPFVRRIDGAFGDRNLVCSCPPIEALASV
jgi:glycine dehydrogenase